MRESPGDMPVDTARRRIQAKRFRNNEAGRGSPLRTLEGISARDRQKGLEEAVGSGRCCPAPESHLDKAPEDDTPEGFVRRQDQVQGIVAWLVLYSWEDQLQRFFQVSLLFLERGIGRLGIFGCYPEFVDHLRSGLNGCVGKLIDRDVKQSMDSHF